MIKKTIHYCWFGGNPKNEIILKCMESWKKYCPDYEIIEWNETNFDVNMNKFTEEAYKNHKWAFVSDVARLYIIYNYGGIYLDTDIELKDNLDEWLNYDGWFAFQYENTINTGLGLAGKKGNRIVKLLLDDYENRRFVDENGNIVMQVCSDINTELLRKKLPELIMNNKDQIIENTLFLSADNYNLKAKNHGGLSWTDHPKTEIQPEKEYKNTRLKKFLRNYKIQYYIKDHFNENIFKLYSFMAYDMLDNGLLYYIKRQIKKRVQ